MYHMFPLNLYILARQVRPDWNWNTWGRNVSTVVHIIVFPKKEEKE